MTLVQKEPKSIKLGTTDIKKVYLGSTQVRPKARTFTISWTEQSNMSSGWTYSDDAAGLTAGSTDFDEFFGYSAVKLSTAGVETAEVTQTSSGGAGKLKITDLGTLTSGDNVMIKFPVRGIKMSKSGSVVTLSITEELNKTGYQYFAHTSSGTITSPGTPKDAFYLGAYKGYNNSNVIKSWSGQSPTAGLTHSNWCSYTKANGSGYNIMGFYQREYINALYIMKYGNPDSQSVVGQGYTGGSAKVNTGGTNSQTNATYGTSSTTVQCKLFGLEDRWGNLSEVVGGMYTDGSKVLYTMLTGWSGNTSGGASTGATLNGSNNKLSSIVGTNAGMFAPLAVASGYYQDFIYTLASRLGDSGGPYNYAANAGAFELYIGTATSAASGVAGCRIMYLNGLT